MNNPLVALPLSAPIPHAIRKKRVLLVDTSPAKLDLRAELRAEVLRKLGMDVDSAVDIAEARAWWRPALYHLVLVNIEKGQGQRDKFCDDLRSATPPQRAFLVGQPEYLADSPNADQELLMESGDELVAIGTAKVSFPDPGDTTQGWGILEASRRITAVRSASVARTRAMGARLLRYEILKDDQKSQLRHRPALDDLLKEELR